MSSNELRNRTYILRSQVEYNTETRTAALRCILEIPATGERYGFASMDGLLAALRSHLSEIQEKGSWSKGGEDPTDV